MPQSLRAFVPGGRFFCKVTLLERHRKLLTDLLENLQASFMAPRQRQPFTVKVNRHLSDQLHGIGSWPLTVTYDELFLTLSGWQMMTFGV
jgi:hypothetical protein